MKLSYLENISNRQFGPFRETKAKFIQLFVDSQIVDNDCRATASDRQQSGCQLNCEKYEKCPVIPCDGGVHKEVSIGHEAYQHDVKCVDYAQKGAPKGIVKANLDK